MIERRTKPRFRLKAPIATKIRTILNARMLDISPEGALLELGFPLATRLTCDLRIRHEADDIVVSGTTRRCRPGLARINEKGEKNQFFLVGLQFEDAARDSIVTLLSHIPPEQVEVDRRDDMEFGEAEAEYTGGTRWISEADITVSVHMEGGDALEPHPMVIPPDGSR